MSRLLALFRAASFSIFFLAFSALSHAQALSQITPVSVSDSAHLGDYVPANTLDNNFSSRWTVQGLGQYIQYDLGTIQKIGQVKLAWEKQHDYAFDILVSSDGAKFVRVGARRTSAANTLRLESFDAAATGRYVRIVGYGYTGQTWISITEAQILGPQSTAPPVLSWKWHPGYYVWPTGSMADTPTNRAVRLRFIDSIGLEPSVEGIELIVYWGDLEGDTPGDYSKGFQMIDAYLAKLGSQPLPKRLILEVRERVFGASAGDPKTYYPAYVVDNGWVDVRPPDSVQHGGLYSTSMAWKPQVMDRLIALTRAYAARYNSHPLVEMFSLEETALHSPSGNGGFSTDGYGVQLKRWCTAAKAAWPNTQLRLVANFHGSNARMRDLIGYCASGGGMAIGGPDPEMPLPDVSHTIQSNEVFRGLDGGADLRGVFPWVGEQQGIGLGRRYTEDPAEILKYQIGVMQASYVIWLQNTYLGGDAQRWKTGILPLLQTTTMKPRTACPTAYKGRCNSRE